jgi:hypothetical protein
LQLEEDHRINGRSSGNRIELAHQIVDKREIQNLLQMAVKTLNGKESLTAGVA